MTGRERILNAVKGIAVDKTPICPFVYSNVVKERYGKGCDVIQKTAEFCDELGFDLMHRNFNIRFDEFEQSDKRVEKQTSNRGNVEIERTILNAEGKTLTSSVEKTLLTPNLSVVAQTEFFVKDFDDLDTLIDVTNVRVFTADLAQLKKAKSVVAEKGVVAPWYNGVFNYMSILRKLDDLLIDPYVDEKFYDKFANFCVARLIKGIEPILKEGVDFVSYSGNIASGKLVGAEYFEKFVLPYEKIVIDFIQQQGTGVIYHNCGFAQNMIDVYNKLDLCVYESMTQPPYADNNFDDFVEKFNPKTCLMGNIDQIEFLKSATKEEVANEAKCKIKKASGRKFILGTSDFIEEGTPRENLIALANANRD